MNVIPDYKEIFLDYLAQRIEFKEPENLYEPIRYILGLGGKKIRPILTLMSADVFGVDYRKALDAALAVEIFHNFTLVHDDIMDDAPLRRGNSTVHEKWDINIGILSGDAMMILAYRALEGYDSEIFKKLNLIFSKTALEVCEGQQLDVDFETRNDVTITAYLNMISLKTSVLVACALKMGAIVAEASEEASNKMYDFGLNLGIAFQLQDDYLDTYGNSKSFGKQIGGDIIENKKTFLYLSALKASDEENKEKLLKLYAVKLNENEEKISKVKIIFDACDVSDLIRAEIKKYTEKALAIIKSMNIREDKKQLLYSFADSLMRRDV